MAPQKVEGGEGKGLLPLPPCVTARQNLVVRRETKVHAGVLLLAAKDLYFALPATLND